jgi:hypothetical protein
VSRAEFAELDSITGVRGERLAEVLASWPWASGDATGTRMAPGRIHAFVELHIEQDRDWSRSGPI